MRSDSLELPPRVPSLVRVERYAYLRSLEFLLSPAADRVLRRYDAVLRTDCDTFVTPAFARWAPSPRHAFVVGLGRYAYRRQTREALFLW